MMLERNVVDTVTRRAEAAGWLVRKIEYVGSRNCPDCIFIRDGKVVFIEFKRPDEEPRTPQLRELQRLAEAGADVYIVSGIESGCRLLGLNLDA